MRLLGYRVERPTCDCFSLTVRMTRTCIRGGAGAMAGAVVRGVVGGVSGGAQRAWAVPLGTLGALGDLAMAMPLAVPLAVPLVLPHGRRRRVSGRHR